nr:hypothetical protein [Pseudoroseomonas rhizosphaerae]
MAEARPRLDTGVVGDAIALQRGVAAAHIEVGVAHGELELAARGVAHHAAPDLTRAAVPHAGPGEHGVGHGAAFGRHAQAQALGQGRRYLDAAQHVLLAEAERRGADVEREVRPRVAGCEGDAGGGGVGGGQRPRHRRRDGHARPGQAQRVAAEAAQRAGILRHVAGVDVDGLRPQRHPPANARHGGGNLRAGTELGELVEPRLAAAGAEVEAGRGDGRRLLPHLRQLALDLRQHRIGGRRGLEAARVAAGSRAQTRTRTRTRQGHAAERVLRGDTRRGAARGNARGNARRTKGRAAHGRRAGADAELAAALLGRQLERGAGAARIARGTRQPRLQHGQAWVVRRHGAAIRQQRLGTRVLPQRQRGIDGAGARVEVARVALQHRLGDALRLARLARALVEAGERQIGVGVLRVLPQRRHQPVIGGGLVALLVQPVAGADGDAGMQTGELPALIGGQARVLGELGGELRRFRLHAALQQRAGQGDAPGRRRAAVDREGDARRLGRAAAVPHAGQRLHHQARRLAARIGARGERHQPAARLVRLAILGRLGGGGHLLLDAHAAQQTRLVGAAQPLGDALHKGGGIPGAALLGGEEGGGVQRLGLAAGGKLVQHGAALQRLALARQGTGKIEGDPGIVRRGLLRGAQQRQGGGRIGAAGGLGAQRFRALRGGRRGEGATMLRGELLRLREAPLLLQGVVEPGQGVVQVGPAGQGGAVALLGAQRVVAAQRQVAEQRLGIGALAALAAGGGQQQRLRLVELAALDQAAGLGQLARVACAIQRAAPFAPALPRVGGDGGGEQPARLGRAALAQPHQPEPARGVRVARIRRQHALEGLRGLAQPAGVQRLEAADARLAHLVHRPGRRIARLLQPLAKRRVARIGAQVVLDGGGGLRVRALPQQRLAPGGARRLGGVLPLRERLEAADALRARALAVGQDLRVGQGQPGVAGAALGQPLHGVACLGIAFLGAGQRLVVLDGVVVGRGAAAEHLPVARHGLGLLAGLRQPPRLGHGARIDRGAAHRKGGVRQARIGRGELADARQQPVRLGAVAVLRLRRGGGGKRVHVVGLDREHPLQRLQGAVGSVLAAPEIGLLQQHADGAVLRPRRGGGQQGQKRGRDDRGQEAGAESGHCVLVLRRRAARRRSSQ